MTINYDHETGFNLPDGEFYCPHCGRLMTGTGIFAAFDENDPHNLDLWPDGLVCIPCEHFMDAHMPHRLLAALPEDHVLYDIRFAACRRILDATVAVFDPVADDSVVEQLPLFGLEWETAQDDDDEFWGDIADELEAYWGDDPADEWNEPDLRVSDLIGSDGTEDELSRRFDEALEYLGLKL